MEDLFSSEQSTKSQFSTLVNGHLGSALNPAKVGFLQTVNWGEPSAYKREYPEYIQALQDNEEYQVEIQTHYMHSFFCDVMDTTTPFKTITLKGDWKAQLTRSIEYVTRDLNAARRLYGSTLTTDGFVERLKSLSTESEKRISQMYQWKLLFEEAVLWSGQRLSKAPDMTELSYWILMENTTSISLELGCHKLTVTPNLILVLDRRKRELMVAPRDFLLLLSDKVTERFIVYYSTLLGSLISPDLYPSLDLCITFIEAGDGILRCMGNKAFDILSSSEALTTGRLLKNGQGEILNHKSFWENTITELKLSSYPSIQRFAISLWINIIDGVSNPHHLSQLFGLYRIWGHPWIDAIKGIEKVKSVALVDKLIAPGMPDHIAWKFKEVFLTNYKMKKGEYPDLILDQDKPSGYLLSCLSLNEKFSTRHPDYRMQDFQHVTISKCFSIPLTYNLSALLSDKAISLNRTELRRNCSRGKYSSVMDNIYRRAILSWLRSNLTDPERLLREINDYGLTKEDLLIGVYGKERELKIAARFFALLTLRCRLYFTMTEEMLADHVLPFIPGVTMKDNLLVLQKKMLDISSGLNAKQALSRKGTTYSTTVVFNIDFTKWNLNMRYETTGPLFRQLGLLFGLENIYLRTHEIFYQSDIYLADGTYIPRFDKDDNIIPDRFAWSKHQGGFEGLRQKGWTILTIMILEMICSRHSVTYKLTGQGDNQVLSVSFYHTSVDLSEESKNLTVGELRQKKDRFLYDLDTTCTAAGLSIKLLETWQSQNLYAYGKHLYWNGFLLCMSLKKLARAFYLSNDSIATIDNSMGAISANVQTAAMSDLITVIPLLVMKMEGISCLNCLLLTHSPLMGEAPYRSMKRDRSRWSVLLPDKRRITRSLDADSIKNLTDITPYYEVILNLPRSLGGFSITNLLNINSRGFPDPVTESLTWLLMLSADPTNPYKDIYHNLCHPELSPVVNMEMIIQDPLALNLLIPTSGLGILNSEIEAMLRDPAHVRNKYFTDILKVLDPIVTHELYNVISTMSPYWPRLAHDLYSSTAVGYVKQCVSKVSSTVTIRKIAIHGSSLPIMDKLAIAENAYVRSVIWRLGVTPGLDFKISCSRLHAEYLREVGWQQRLFGITTPHPAEIFSTEFHKGIPECRSKTGYLLALMTPEATKPHEEIFTKRGPFTPYLGSYVKDKAPSYLHDLISEEPALRKASSLVKLIHWLIPANSNLHYYVTQNLWSLSSSDYTLPEPELLETSGSAEHRYHDEVTKHGGLLGTNPSLGSYFSLTSDYLKEYARGTENVTLHFQSALCQLSNIATAAVLYNHQYNGMITCIHQHLFCPTCIRPVDEDKPDLEESREMISALFARIGDDYPARIQAKDVLEHYTAKERYLSDLSKSQRLLSNEEAKSLVYQTLSYKAVAESNKVTGHYASAFKTETFDRAWWYRISAYDLTKNVLTRMMEDIIITKFKDFGIYKPTLLEIKEEIAIKLQRDGDALSSLYNVNWYDSDLSAKFLTSLPDTTRPTNFPITARAATNASKDYLIRACLEYNLDYCRPKYNVLAHRTQMHLFGRIALSNMIWAIYRYEICYHCKVWLSECFLNIDQNTEWPTPEEMKHITNPLCSHDCEFGLFMEKVRYEIIISDVDALVRRNDPAMDCHYNIRSPRIQPLQGLLEVFSPYDFDEMKLDVTATAPYVMEFNFPENNYTQHIWRPWVREASTLYKYLEITNIDTLKGLKKLFVVGDGMGGLTDVLCRNSEDDCKIWFSTLIIPDGVDSQAFPTSVPPLAIEHVGKKLQWNPEMLSMTNNLLDPDFAQEWRSVLGDKIDIIYCDAELPDYTADKFIIIVNHLLLLSPDGIIIKHQLDLEGLQLAFLKQLTHYQNIRVTVSRSPYAQQESLEVISMLNCTNRIHHNIKATKMILDVPTSIKINTNLRDMMRVQLQNQLDITNQLNLRDAFFGGIPWETLLKLTLIDLELYPFPASYRAICQKIIRKSKVPRKFKKERIIKTMIYRNSTMLISWLLCQGNFSSARTLALDLNLTLPALISHREDRSNTLYICLITDQVYQWPSQILKQIYKACGRVLFIKSNELVPETSPLVSISGKKYNLVCRHSRDLEDEGWMFWDYDTTLLADDETLEIYERA